MGKLSLKEKVCVLISWALMLVCGAAEQQYFHQLRRLTWDEARHHCQVCFKDLVTLTPENIQTIAKELTSDSWVGLRKSFYSTRNSTSNSTSHSTRNSTSNSTSYSTNNSTRYSTSNPTSNTRMSWSHWANGDPLTFQNWYPGWPVFKSSFPKRDCCSCSCTCPATMTPRMTSYTTRFTEFTTPNVTAFTGLENVTAFTGLENVTAFTGLENVTDFTGLENVTDFTGLENVTDFTGLENVTGISSFTDVTDQNVTSFSEWANVSTQNTPRFTTAAPSLLPVEGECVRSPMLSPDVPDPDENYIEDSCVAMLTFGAWVEKNCLERLPFICYDDRFFGHVNVTNVTSRSAVLEWLPGPGDISHHRLVVREHKELTKNLTKTDMTYKLANLTAGTGYSVQVFPVKCGRDLNPQEATFITTPNKIENLNVSNVTSTSISLSWNKPAGNVDFYLIKVQERNLESSKECKLVDDLIPGNSYTFTVLSGVKDSSTWSEESNITAYTKPATVSNLNASENTNNSLILKWVLPKGSATDYLVKAMNDSHYILFDEVVDQTEVNVTGLPAGTKITLSVTARANHTLEGHEATCVSYTAPGPVSNLKTETTHDTLTATWNPPEGHFSKFTVKLWDGENTKTEHTTAHRKDFSGLKTSAKYTVIVYSVSGHLYGPPVEKSSFTSPQPPTDAKVSSFNKHSITFTWMPPANTATVMYLVKLSSIFWSHSFSALVNKTSHTFPDLRSGTRYDFEVQTKAGGNCSEAVSLSHYTVAEKREVSLSMLCSSKESLLCDNSTTRDSVFQKLHAYFEKELGNMTFWKLEK